MDHFKQGVPTGQQFLHGGQALRVLAAGIDILWRQGKEFRLRVTQALAGHGVRLDEPPRLTRGKNGMQKDGIAAGIEQTAVEGLAFGQLARALLDFAHHLRPGLGRLHARQAEVGDMSG